MTTEKDENRTLGGYKATLHNPNTSNEAKTHAAEILQSHGETLSEEDKRYLSCEGHEHGHHGKQHHVVHEISGFHDAPIPDKGEGQTEHDHRVLGGFRATLDNPRSSEAAKDHAAEVLIEHGEKI